jgi:CRISPR-associated protein Cas1
MQENPSSQNNSAPEGDSDLLKTLYIQEQGSSLRKTGERLLVEDKQGQTLMDIPAEKVQQIVIMGNCSVTTPAMILCLGKGIPITFLSNRGHYYGRLVSTQNSTAEILLQQVKTYQTESFRLELARQFVRGKLHNQRVFIERQIREYGSFPDLDEASLALNQRIESLPSIQALDELRGVEGSGARAYFQGLKSILLPEWGFQGRVRQPPTDPVNSLLSFGYTLLFYNLYSLVEIERIDPFLGYYHDHRAGHPALVSDLMEEWRCPVIDSLVLSVIRKNEITLEDFPGLVIGQPCFLSPEARKKFIQLLEKKLQSLIQHPVYENPLPYRRYQHHQVQSLAKSLREEKLHYQPFLWR